MVIAKIPKRGNSSDKIPIEIKSYGGINTLPSRQLGQPSAGKNFYTKNGELYTRPGLLEIDNPPSLSSPIYAIHSCKQAQLTERLIVQSGSELHHRPDELGSWSLVIVEYLVMPTECVERALSPVFWFYCTRLWHRNCIGQ